MKFLYWNLHRNPSLQDCLVALIRDQAPDIAIFSEWNLKEGELLRELNGIVPIKYYVSYNPIPEPDPIIFSRLPQKSVGLIRDREHICVRTIKLSSGAELLLFAVHFPCKRYRDDSDQAAFARILSGIIEEEEKRRVIIILLSLGI
jgi:hypothetical protein